MSLGSTKAKDISLDACYGANASSEWPATIWTHLYGGNPTTGATELTSAGGYAPVSIPNDASGFGPASGGQKTNLAEVNFPASTAAWSASATYFWFTDAESGLVSPLTPAVTVDGTTGTTTWQYVVTAINAVGETTPSGIGVTTVGNTTLSTSDYNALTWPAVTGATGYNVYRLVNSLFQLIGSTSATSFDDTGQAATTQTPPIANGTMNLLDGGPLSAPIIVPDAGYQVSFAAGAIVIQAS